MSNQKMYIILSDTTNVIFYVLFLISSLSFVKILQTSTSRVDSGSKLILVDTLQRLKVLFLEQQVPSILTK